MRLIDADALKKRMLDLNAYVRDVYNSSKTNAEKMLCGQEILGIHESFLLVTDAPTIDAVPVVHSQWIEERIDRHAKGGKPYTQIYHRCKACGYKNKQQHGWNTKFCPECGAKMRKENPNANQSC